MTPNRHDVAAAKARIEVARAQLLGTVAELQNRLTPAHLAQNAVESATQGVLSVARESAEAVRTRPLATAGVVGAIGLFLARGWIGAALKGSDETTTAPAGLKTKRASRAAKGSTT